MAWLSDAVVFDLDGTLADSLGDIGGAMNEALAELQLPAHPLEAYKAFVGEGIEVLAERALPPAGAGRADELLQAFRTRYQARMTQETRLYPGIAELLDLLTARGVKLAVLSNKRDDFTAELVRRLLPRWTFGSVRGARAGVPKKPDPTSALQVAAELKVEPARCLFVGDTAIDMKTATAAGMRAAGVTWGFRPVSELIAAGAQHVVHAPAGLGDLV